MSIGAGLILPGVAPVSASANDGEWRMGDGGFAASSFEEDAAIVSGAQQAQAEFGGGEMIDPRIQVGEATANQIKLDFVECAGASGSTKKNLASGILSLAGNPSGKVQQLGHCLEIRKCVAVGGDASRDGREGGNASLAKLAGQAHGFERGINLERQRLVGPVHEMGVGADAGVGVLTGLVIGPGGLRIAVASHGAMNRRHS